MSTLETTSPMDQDVECPLCGYNLRGLVEARCPECGAAFDFDELRDPARRKHPYLFEHHPERNIGSFARTFIGLCWPWSFWSTLQPIQPSFPRRIALYWLIYSLLTIPFIALRFAADVRFLTAESLVERGWMIRALASKNPAATQPYALLIQRFGSQQKMLSAMAPLPGDPGFYRVAAGLGVGARVGPIPVPHAVQLLWLDVVLIGWPWLTVLVFQIFRITMRRTSIRRSHILRIAVYNGDIIVWIGVLILPLMAIEIAQPASAAGLFRGASAQTLLWSMGLAGFSIPIGLVLYTLRLWVACRRYLRFPHALATVISVQIIVLLSIPATIVVFVAIAAFFGFP